MRSINPMIAAGGHAEEGNQDGDGQERAVCSKRSCLFAFLFCSLGFLPNYSYCCPHGNLVRWVAVETHNPGLMHPRWCRPSVRP